MNENRKQSETIEVVKGIGLAVLLHVIQGLFFLFNPVFFALIGVSQLLYLIPAFLILRKRGRMGMAKGILIGAAVTFLLNAACFGLLASMF